MIGHIAAGIEATGTHAGIAALLPDAGLGGSTFRIDGTLGSTVWWLANEGGCTRAGWAAVELLALGVGSTRRGLAGILWFSWLNLSLLLVTACERISRVARVTRARWIVIDHLAACKLTTSSWTGVDALLLYAGRLQGALRADNTLRFAGWW